MQRPTSPFLDLSEKNVSGKEIALFPALQDVGTGGLVSGRQKSLLREKPELYREIEDGWKVTTSFSMKILAVPQSYLPHNVGGKEIYTHSLGIALAKLGIKQEIMLHASDGTDGDFLYQDIQVRVLRGLTIPDERLHAYARTIPAIPEFEEFLIEARPDIIHFHDQSGGASLSHLRIVNRLGIPSVLTFHTAGQFCPQRALLRNGKRPCDGEVRVGRCTRCRMRSLGMPRLPAALLSLPNPVRYRSTQSGPIRRMLTAREMTQKFRNSNQEFFQRFDAVIALAEWAADVLRINGCPEEKIHLVRTGGRNRPIASIPGKQSASGRAECQGPLKVACVGRCESIKGFHVLVEAVKRLPAALPVEVHFFSPNWGNNEYGRMLQQRIHADPRFQQPRSVGNEELLTHLRAMDVLVVPSICLETGPLTVFDGFAAKLPVIGSNLGGISELVTDGVDGLLFEPGNALELAGILERCAWNDGLLEGLRQQLPQTRTMDEVAFEMSAIYRQLLAADR